MKLLLVCKYQNVGYCKYKDKCRFQHSNEDCDKKYDKRNCMKRHRKICKHGETCKYKLKCEFRHPLKKDNSDPANFESLQQAT